MREIKFRVWLKPEYWNEDENEGLMTTGLPLCGWDKWWLNLDPSNTENSLDGEFTVGKEIEIMQFTGLHDKNGKEIYEGDLINSYQNDYQPTEVFWDNDSCQWSTQNYHSTLNISNSIDSKVEVLGNIYENPELLK